MCAGPPSLPARTLSPLRSSEPPAQVRVRQRATRRASGSPMVATSVVWESDRVRGLGLIWPRGAVRGWGGLGRGEGWVGHLPGCQESSCGGSEGPGGEILIQVI